MQTFHDILQKYHMYIYRYGEVHLTGRYMNNDQCCQKRCYPPLSHGLHTVYDKYMYNMYKALLNMLKGRHCHWLLKQPEVTSSYQRYYNVAKLLQNTLKTSYSHKLAIRYFICFLHLLLCCTSCTNKDICNMTRKGTAQRQTLPLTTETT